jgi:DNA-binding NarL/FixJ family response regulator
VAGTAQLHLAHMTRILIADDCEVVRLGLRQTLEAQPDWQVVAEAADGKEAILDAIASKPDVAIVEYALPVMNGIEVTHHLRRRLPRIEILIFTRCEDDALVFDLLSAGARGYLLKSDAKRYLLEAVASLAAHRPFFTDRISEALLQSFLTRCNRTRTTLTNRERSVVQLIAEGHTNRKIGAFLGIGVKTVETHRAAIMRKLKLASSAALVRYAVRNQLVEL